MDKRMIWPLNLYIYWVTVRNGEELIWEFFFHVNFYFSIILCFPILVQIMLSCTINLVGKRVVDLRRNRHVYISQSVVVIPEDDFGERICTFVWVVT